MAAFVRIASPDDAPKILEIYAPYILETSISFEMNVPTVAEFQNRMQHYLQRFPWIICEVNGQTAGYVYASLYREREAYQWNCECSAYLSNKFRGKGIAAILYNALFDILKKQRIINVYAGITLPNPASQRFHEKCGFKQFALYKNVGYKFGKWHDVGWWELQLNPHDPKPAPLLLFPRMDQSTINPILKNAAQSIDQLMDLQTD
jgi:Sortase and related acyltransferases